MSIFMLFSSLFYFPFYPMAHSVQSSSPDSAYSVESNTAKRHRLNHHRRQEERQSTLIPGLPDHVAQICLSLVPPALLCSVCYSWRQLVYTPSFPPFLSLYTVLSSTDKENDASNVSIRFFSFDPISSRWELLPPPPTDPPLRFIYRHPSFISRDFPIQSVVVSGRLVLLAATTNNFSPALSRPLIFNPLSGNWDFGPPLHTPRRWCAAGVINDAIYVASGVGSQFSADVAKLVERWDFLGPRNENFSGRSKDCWQHWKWEKVKALKDGRFCREAIDAIAWREKLYMVNVKGDAAKEGAVYDTQNDVWEDMPEGMLAGWKGPAAAMNEEVIYSVDESKGTLKKYDPEKDEWDSLMESDRLVRSQHISAGGGRVCVVCSGGIVVVDVVAQPVRLWEVEMPPGFEAVAVHILPRMKQLELGFPAPP